MAFVEKADARALPRSGRVAAPALDRLPAETRRRLLPVFSVAALGLSALSAFTVPTVAPLLLLAAFLIAGALLFRDLHETADDAETETLVTARQRAEEASRAKSRFLATVSHEVRTPLNGILGMTHLLERTALTGEQESYVAAVRRSSSALFDLVADLLDFSAIEAGRLDLRSEPVDLVALVEGTVELMAPRAHECGLDIAASFARDVPRSIVTDDNRLRQVLFNLLGNAVKFTDEGGIAVSVAREGAELVIAVTDTGPGLAPGDRERIFREFEQAEHGLARGHGGVGLGLAISARIVAAMGGTIGVESAAGRGSCFVVRLPLGTEAEGGICSEALRSARILLISANVQTAAALTAAISDEGGTAWHAPAVPDDLPAFCRDRGVTTIIIDRPLEAAAQSVLSKLRAGSPRRILMVRPDERQALDGLSTRGFDGWLVAPVRRSSLIAVLSGDLAGSVAAEAHPDLDRVTTARRPGRTLNILVAEDNPVNALLLTNLLRKEGHSVVHVEDGRALIRALLATEGRRWPFDLLVSDLAMPGMDGLAALSAIRAHQRTERLPHLPIVVLSADGQAETQNAAGAAGADVYVEKPVEPPALLDVVDRLSA